MKQCDRTVIIVSTDDVSVYVLIVAYVHAPSGDNGGGK